MRTVLYTLLLSMLSVGAFAQYNYLGSYDSQGVPDYLVERDVISAQLLADIDAALPERRSVPDYNPQYITAGYNTDLHLTKASAVYVTFLDEGAAYRNVLGFFTYDAKKPVTTKPSASDITIIFPNASNAGSGGGLVAGDRVKIGEFPANTGIGWVLLADGWNGSVTDGRHILYSQPQFNPEADETLRHHNVMLYDDETDRYVLGWEDLRRDFTGCDHDFNDALFIVTTEKRGAGDKDNTCDLDDDNDYDDEEDDEDDEDDDDDCGSGNDGGLESNGDLAAAIAKRNYIRARDNSARNERLQQPSLRRWTNARTQEDTELFKYLPESGFKNTEVAHVSTPEDLLDLTNATEVFANDYYQDNDRVSAALALATEDGVYNHTKAICDRLNGGKLEDLRYVTLKGKQIIYAKMVNPDGTVEYASWFSVREGENRELHSMYNLHKYPAGAYKNFQVWATSPSQAFHLAGYILDQLEAEGALQQSTVEHVLPGIYVQTGAYESGMLNLEVRNPGNISQMQFRSNLRKTELSAEQPFDITIPLSGALLETVSIPVGYLFDIGFEISIPGEPGSDALYMADGPWGIDYLQEYANVSNFVVNQGVADVAGDEHAVERGFSLSASTSEVVNVFRNLRPGHSLLATEGFHSLRFDIRNTQSVEVSLVAPGLTDWNSRLVYTVAPHADMTTVTLNLDELRTAYGQKGSLLPDNLQSVVFSYISDNGENKTVEMEVANMVFSPAVVEPTIKNSLAAGSALIFYPNPAGKELNVMLPEGLSGEFDVEITDMSGRICQKQLFTTDGTSLKLSLELEPAIYVVTVKNNENTYVKRIVVE